MSQLLSSVLYVAALLVVAAVQAAPDDYARGRALKTEGNFKEAFEAFRAAALNPRTGADRGLALVEAIDCLGRLDRTNEFDGFVEAAVAAAPADWQLLRAAGEAYLDARHEGFLVAGAFHRGDHRGGGKAVDAAARDRVRGLQLLEKARIEAERQSVAAALKATIFRALVRGWQQPMWRLQAKTDLAVLPDYDDRWGRWGADSPPPVDEKGEPVFFALPPSLDAAANDGQRWRWCLRQAMDLDPDAADALLMDFANTIAEQYDVHTIVEYGGLFDDDDGQANAGALTVHTLAEDETIARLAGGVRRFKLPSDYNFIALYKAIVDRRRGPQVAAAQRLANLFEDRRQYPRAAHWWRYCVDNRGNDDDRAGLQQVVGNWGRFEPVAVQAAGEKATFDFVFRNGRSVEFVAEALDVERLLADVKEYLTSQPKQFDWNKTSFDLGSRIVGEKQRRYVGAEAARWTVALEPRADHVDRRQTVDLPLRKGGAYLLTARMAGGNTCHLVVWLADLAVVRKPLDGKLLYFVARADDGTPVQARVEFFGWSRREEPNRLPEVHTREFAEETDAAGLVALDGKAVPENNQWLAVARAADGRMGFLGFDYLGVGRRRDAPYRQTRVYAITDRPVYRPGQKVHYKLWLRRAEYDMADRSDFAGMTYALEVRNPKGERIVRKDAKTDDYGGIAGELELPADAPLGVYALQVAGKGGGQFRVEEYKKPEFEVTVEAPAEPVSLGDAFQATIRAKYYFGAPVTRATVKYKVERSIHTQRWFPPMPWDWLYGPGYRRLGPSFAWLTGWDEWGLRPIARPWWPTFDHTPPEVIADRQVEIGADGEVKFAVDTALARALHADKDHRYTITVEVVDQSRRTIVGRGEVLVARKPFVAQVWVDRGHYRQGETIAASAYARTVDNKPVAAAGELVLYRIEYADGKANEQPQQRWPLATDAAGEARLQIKAARAGQYRLACRLTDARGRAVEAGHVFMVTGEGAAVDGFRFNDIELVPERAEYRPGETVRLLVNANRRGASVLLFVRPVGGVYLPPKLLKLDGQSTMAEIVVAQGDMPNFFVEAVTVSGARVHTEVCEIFVPPEKRVLDVAVQPSAAAYKPGEKAKVALRLTDAAGQPHVGSVVVAVYDKSLEYIAGGSNVPEIRAFFWKWRRQHHPQGESNADVPGGNIDQPGAAGMQTLGRFGAMAMSFAHVARDKAEAFGMGGFGRAMPMMAFAAPSNKAMAEGAADGVGEAAAAPGDASPTAPAAVRSKFADTALWVGTLTTDGDGRAEVDLAMPDNLTTWRIKTWAMGHGTKVGEGFADVVTRKDFLVRMQAPRFFVQTDEVVLTANVHNYLKSAKRARVVLDVDGKRLKLLQAAEQAVQIAAGGEARVDWRVSVLDEGPAVVRMKALSDEESDAMEIEIPCRLHGMLKTESFSGVVGRGEDGRTVRFSVPAARRAEQTRLVVRYSPTLAGAMVDALPYLIDYPYGCTEQTLNRFLPAVQTQQTLRRMGLRLDDARRKQTNLNAQEIGDAAKRAEGWKSHQRNAVFDEAELGRVVKTSVARLAEMQLPNGAWGWFSGWGERPSPYFTALVVRGLTVAKANEVALRPQMYERAVKWLADYQGTQVRLLEAAAAKPRPRDYRDAVDNLDVLVYLALVEAGTNNAAMLAFVERDRAKLGVYSLALYGLALQQQGEAEKLARTLRNLRQYLEEDRENQTAWLRMPAGNVWWCWHGSEIETQATYLKLLARTEPQGPLAPQLVKYLLNNRKHAARWNSTRDTALCVDAMADYLKASGEERPRMTVEVLLDGRPLKSVEVTPENLFGFDATVVVEGGALAAGEHRLELRRRGEGPLYFNAYLTNFTLEELIDRAGLEVKVLRRYYRLDKTDATALVAGDRGQAIDQKTAAYRRTELANLATVASGQLVEIELEIESKNDYECLVFEDMKPAGFEPVDLRSGYTGNELGAYVEFRDERVAFFTARLARGRHSVSYRMRAETPGRFSALPTYAHAMYAPELRANSDEIKLVVEDKPAP